MSHNGRNSQTFHLNNDYEAASLIHKFHKYTRNKLTCQCHSKQTFSIVVQTNAEIGRRLKVHLMKYANNMTAPLKIEGADFYRKGYIIDENHMK